jgi:hypothetical protein
MAVVSCFGALLGMAARHEIVVVPDRAGPLRAGLFRVSAGLGARRPVWKSILHTLGCVC